MKKSVVFIALSAMLICSSAIAFALEADILGGVQIHGFISQGYLNSNEYNYLAHNSKEGSFEYNEVGINFGKQLTDKLRVGMQLFSRDLGDIANNKVTLDWAYGDYRFRDWFGIRAGKIKLPLGLYNETRDMDMLRTSVVLPQGRLYYDLFRDNLIAINGLGLYGNVGMGPAGGLEYQLLAGAMNSDYESGPGKYTTNSLGGLGTVEENPDNDTLYCGNIRWDIQPIGLKLGYTFYDSSVSIPVKLDDFLVNLLGLTDSTIAIDSESFAQVFSVEYTWNNLLLAAEYLLWHSESDVLGSTRESDLESYYFMASYRFTDWFTLGAYYSEYYPDKDDKDGEKLAIDHKAWEKDLALTLRFDINDYWVFKLEGHSVDGTANVLAIDNAGNDYDEEDWYYGAVKLTFSF